MDKRGVKLVLVLFLLAVIMPVVVAIFPGDETGQDPDSTIVYHSGGPLICNAGGKWEQGGNVLDPQPRCDAISGGICCPENNVCIEGECVPDVAEQIPTNCGEFTDKDSCGSGIPDLEFIYETTISQLNNAGVNFDSNDLLDSDFCASGNNFFSYEYDGQCRILKGPCKCEWEDDTDYENGGVCKGSVAEFQYAPNSADTNLLNCEDIIEVNEDNDGLPGDTITECRTISSPLEDLCDVSGYYLLSWTAQIYLVEEDGTSTALSGSEATSPTCRGGDKTFSCPESIETEIPFFTMVNLMMSLVIIVTIYFLLVFYRKK